jgi:hypothetical protein
LKIHRNVFILTIVYILIVVLFAIIYYTFWQNNPDNFIAQEEINLFPITELRQLLQSDNLNIPLYDSNELEFSLNQISSITEEQKQELVATYSEMKRLQDLSDLQWQQISDISAKLAEITNENFKKNIDSQTRSLRDHEQELVEKISSLEKIAETSSNPNANLQLQLEISNLKVEVIETRIDILNKENKLYQEYLNDVDKFQDPTMVALRDELYASYEENQTKLGKVRDAYYELRGKVYDIWVDIRDARVQRLSYFDFLYFSFTISLASPFGDIIPNSKIIRILVFVQLFIDIFLIGFFVTSFTDFFSKKPLRNIRINNRFRFRRKINRNI